MTTFVKGKSLITTEEFITCPYCGPDSKRWRYLHWRHLKISHNKKLDDVRTEFPDHPTMTKSFDDERLQGSQKSSQTHNKPKKIQCIHCKTDMWVKKNEGNRQACQTCLDKGFENPDGRTKPEAQVNRVKTFQDKYGVDNPQQIEEAKTKASKTCDEKYGGRGFASKTLAKKTRKTIKKEYGAENIMQTEEGFLRFIEGLQKRFGLEITNAQQVFEVRRKTTETLKKIYKEKGHHLTGMTYDQIHGKEKAKELIKQRRVSGGYGYKKSLEQGYGPSKPQKKLFQMLQDLFPGAEMQMEKQFLNEQFGFHYYLDIAIPEIKLCIEYDTDWTHKNKSKDDFRDKVLKKFGWNTLRIRNKLPTEDELLDLLEEYI